MYIQWNCTYSSLQANPWESLWRVIKVPEDWNGEKINTSLKRLGKSDWVVLIPGEILEQQSIGKPLRAEGYPASLCHEEII